MGSRRGRFGGRGVLGGRCNRAEQRVGLIGCEVGGRGLRGGEEPAGCAEGEGDVAGEGEVGQIERLAVFGDGGDETGVEEDDHAPDAPVLRDFEGLDGFGRAAEGEVGLKALDDGCGQLARDCRCYPDGTNRIAKTLP